MKLEIEIPSPDVLLSDSCEAKIAPKGSKWAEACLGKFAKVQGVYVIHHDGQIVYVGKTNSPSMSFGKRLRREFQETASADKHIFPLLAKLSVPPPILVALVPSESISKLVKTDGISLNDYERIEIVEAVFIQAFRPKFQLHQISRVKAVIRKTVTDEATVKAMMDTLRSTPRPFL
jgi:hypothetical protein